VTRWRLVGTAWLPLLLASAGAATAGPTATEAVVQLAPPVDFAREILPIFARACVACHGPEKASGGLQLVNAHRLRQGGIGDDLLVPGQARASYLVQRLRGEGGEDRMPLKAKPLSASDLALIERWIDQGAPLPAEAPPRFVPAPGGLKRLTVAQYRNTLRDLFGPGIPLPADLEPDTLVAGSATVGAARVALSTQGLEKFAVAAFAVGRAAQADPTFRQRYLACPGGASAATESCLRGFVTAFGRRAWRRPLTPAEIGRYVALAADLDRGREVSAASPGIAAVIAAMLQSPHFLYRAEIGEPDPADPSRRRLTGYELAARLSYFLWGAPPDDALLDAAAAGLLATPEGLEAQTRRMLPAARSRETMADFFVELFRLRRLDKISESRTKYPQYSPTLGASLRGETLRVIEEVAFAPARDFREIFATRFTWVNAELARLYGLPAASAAAPPGPDGYWRVELPADSGRTGVLGQGAFLTIFAHPTTSSPTKRGKFIRESLLCQAVPPPPPNVDAKLPKDEPGKPARTIRQKLEAHRKNPRCNGCHKAMDPLGLAFERFDGVGAGRVSEAGRPIDTSGEFDGVPFQDAAGLGTLLARSPKIGACVARSLFRFAVGHLESEGEEPLLEALARGLEQDGYQFDALVANVIKSEGFRTIAAPAVAAVPTATAQAAHAQGD
jgi:mono/diheme cytochrome c family protein